MKSTKKKLNSLFLFVLIGGFAATASPQIRNAVWQGNLYKADKQELLHDINTFYENAKPALSANEIKALWVPHSGYRFSGQIAANAYYSVSGTKLDAIIIVAPCHNVALKSISVGNYAGYKTPLGVVKVHKEIADKLLEEVKDAVFNKAAHDQEHAVEVQLPFIQTALPGTPIVPVLVGKLDTHAIKKISKAIYIAAHKYNILLVACSDMSHYPSYDDALGIDGQVLKAIEDFNITKIGHLTKSLLQEKTNGLNLVLRSWPALQIVMQTTARYEAKRVEVLPYTNSGDISGNRARVVGYGAAVFHKKKSRSKKGDNLMDAINFTEEETDKLFSIARRSIIAALQKKEMDRLEIKEDNLKLKRGVFVTLNNRGKLRGCIGNFNPAYPLWDLVARMAASAATQDYRFSLNPVTIAEMEHIDISISVLSEMKKISSIKDIEIGKHGIWIRKGNRSGTYLPEVAVDMGWNTIEFLEHCCEEKVGLEKNSWKKNADIYIYSSQVLKEK